MVTTILIIVLLWAIASAILLLFTCMCASKYRQSLITPDNPDAIDSDRKDSTHPEHNIST